MAVISFTIPDEELHRVVDAINGLFPVPVNVEGTPLFTENQWTKEYIRRFIIKQVRRYELQEAVDALDIPEDNSLVS